MRDGLMLLVLAESDNWEKAQFKEIVVNGSHKGTSVEIYPCFVCCFSAVLSVLSEQCHQP